MKKLIIISIIVLSFISCEKAKENKRIKSDNIPSPTIQTETTKIDTVKTIESAPSVKNESEIPLALRKQVFYDLVAEQDKLHGTKDYVRKSRENIAKKYNLTIDQIKKISIEGNLNNWPMPNP